jgi:GNAT superfamily N-acetyltransferase
MKIITERKNDFVITTDRTKLDILLIHDFLSNKAYWSKNIPLEKVKMAIENSLNFALFYKNKQVGYARIVSDFSAIAYLGDVFIIEEYRGQGLSKWLMETIVSHPHLQNLRRWILLTGDAHELYKKYGWKPIAAPERWMEKHDPNVYSK